jgi:hypothetical protein
MFNIENPPTYALSQITTGEAVLTFKSWRRRESERERIKESWPVEEEAKHGDFSVFFE